MRDITQHRGRETPYECFGCGEITQARQHPRCPDCGREMRNRQKPLE